LKKNELLNSPLRIPATPPSFPLLVRNPGGQRGIHSCTHSQNATRVRVCPVHTWSLRRGPARRDMAEKIKRVPRRGYLRNRKSRIEKYNNILEIYVLRSKQLGKQKIKNNFLIFLRRLKIIRLKIINFVFFNFLIY